MQCLEQVDAESCCQRICSCDFKTVSHRSQAGEAGNYMCVPEHQAGGGGNCVCVCLNTRQEGVGTVCVCA